MAFTQERAINLINAATDFYQAIIRIRQYASSLQTDLEYHKTSPEYAFSALILFLSETNTNLFTDWAAAITTLTLEHSHFVKAQKRNAREAERQREKRAHLPKREYVTRITNAPTELMQRPETNVSVQGMGRRGELEKKRLSYEQVHEEIERLRKDGGEDQVFDFNVPHPNLDDQTPVPKSNTKETETFPDLPPHEGLPPPGSSNS